MSWVARDLRYSQKAMNYHTILTQLIFPETDSSINGSAKQSQRKAQSLNIWSPLCSLPCIILRHLFTSCRVRPAPSTDTADYSVSPNHLCSFLFIVKQVDYDRPAPLHQEGEDKTYTPSPCADTWLTPSAKCQVSMTFDRGK